MNKPQATYQNVEFHQVPAGEYAIVTRSTHPVLGKQSWLRTSMVLSKERNDNDDVIGFSTLNTEYRQDRGHFL